MKIKPFVLAVVVASMVPFLAVVAAAEGAAAAQHAMTPGEMPSAGESPSSLVDQVRQVTQAFRDTPPPGYEQFLGCVSGPEGGAMGVHFVNNALVGDGIIDVQHPEALIYEKKNGALRLVGVEYIVPVDSWQKPQPPILDGQSFQFVPTPNRYGLPALYELHVWAWRDNPTGAFADWNMHVSCNGQ